MSEENGRGRELRFGRAYDAQLWTAVPREPRVSAACQEPQAPGPATDGSGGKLRPLRSRRAAVAMQLCERQDDVEEYEK